VSGTESDEDSFAGMSLVLPDRELRVTRRCLNEDLGGGGSQTLQDVADHPVVKAFLRERRSKFTGTRKVEPLTSGMEVWVLTQGQRHRGGTWHEAKRKIVWLLAGGHHESGYPTDFFPYCKGLDQEGRLAPSKKDYEELLLEQDARFAAQILIEGPLLRKRAEHEDGEITAKIGGRFGVAVAIEIAEDIKEISVAFDLRSVEVQEYIQAILAALDASGRWDYAERMPSRELEHYEVAFSLMTLGG
jgi:hypothetical protein